MLAIFVLILPASFGQTGKTGSDSHKWKKDADHTWQGKKEGKTYWYRFDKKGKLQWSEDGRNFDRLGSGIWYDKNERMLMISESRLMASSDGGKTWENAPDWKWQGSDGKWYKFDKDWTLWVAL